MDAYSFDYVDVAGDEQAYTEASSDVALDDWPDIVWDYLVVSETEMDNDA